MMAAGEVALPVTPAPTRQGRRRRRRQRRRGGGGGTGCPSVEICDGFSSSQDTCSSHLRGRINPLVEVNAGVHWGREREREAPRGIVWDRLSPERRSLRDRIKWPPVEANAGAHFPVEANAGAHFPLKRGREREREAPKGIVWDRLGPEDLGIEVRNPRREREREAPRRIVWDRLSPEQPICRSLRERIKWPQSLEDLGIEGRNPRRSPTLGELKSGKTAENKCCTSHSVGGQRSYFLRRKIEASGVSFSETGDEAARIKERKVSLGGSSGMSAAETRNTICSPPAKEIASDYAHSDKEKCQSHEDAHKKNREGSLGGSSGTSAAESSDAVCSPPAKEIASYYAPSDKEKCKSSEDAHKKKWKGSLSCLPGTSVAETKSLGGCFGRSTAETTNVVCSPLAKEIAIDYAHSDKEECQSQEDAFKENMRGSLGGSYGTSFSETSNSVCSPSAKEISRGYSPSGKEEYKSLEDADKEEEESLGGSSVTSFAEASDAVCSPPAKEIACDHVHNDNVECKSQEGVVIEAIEDHDMMYGTIMRGGRTMSISGPVVSEKLGNEGRNLSRIAENKEPLHSFGGRRNSFERPKPLDVVLKRKRESTGVMLSETGDHNKKWKAIEDNDVMFMLIRGVRTMSISKA